MPGQKRTLVQAMGSQAPTGSRKKVRTAKPAKKQGRFKGEVIMDGTRESPEEAIAAASEAEEHKCEAGDISMTIACDASVDDKAKGSGGGYGLVFKRVSPGRPTHGMAVQQAWTLSPAFNNNLVEAIAVLQALWQASYEIRTAIKEKTLYSLGTGSTGSQPGSLSTRGNAIKVTILTDSKRVLQSLLERSLSGESGKGLFALAADAPSSMLETLGAQGSFDPVLPSAQSAESPSRNPFIPAGTFPPGYQTYAPVPLSYKTAKELLDDVIERSVQASEDLQNLPDGVKVDLKLRWVPAHILGPGMLFHPMANELASEARLEGRHFHKVGPTTMPFAPSVVGFIKDCPMATDSDPRPPVEDERTGLEVMLGTQMAEKRAMLDFQNKQFESAREHIDTIAMAENKAHAEKREEIEATLKQAKEDQDQIRAAQKQVKEDQDQIKERDAASRQREAALIAAKRDILNKQNSADERMNAADERMNMADERMNVANKKMKVGLELEKKASGIIKEFKSAGKVQAAAMEVTKAADAEAQLVREKRACHEAALALQKADVDEQKRRAADREQNDADTAAAQLVREQKECHEVALARQAADVDEQKRRDMEKKKLVAYVGVVAATITAAQFGVRFI